MPVSFTYEFGGLPLDVVVWMEESFRPDAFEVGEIEVEYLGDSIEIDGLAQRVRGEWVPLHRLLAQAAQKARLNS